MTRPCPFCEEASWRFNGRAWYASDPATGRRHVCAVGAAPGTRRLTVVESNGRSAVDHEQPERIGALVGVGLAAALAGILGAYAIRARRR